MNPPDHTLLDTPQLLVRRVFHPSPLCVVTFNNYNDDAAPAQAGFAQAFLDGHGIDAIHLVSGSNDWFQQPGMPAAIATIRGALDGKPAVTYGSSMGGYAAIRFAGALGARQAIAISPQYALARRVVPFERRWRAEARRVRFLHWPEVAAPPPVIAFYDPHNPDAEHLERWAAERTVTRVRLPHAGHPASTFLAEFGLLGPAILDILAGRFDPAALVDQAHAHRRRSACYHFTLAKAQPPSRPVTALRLMRQAARLAPNSAHYHSQLAMALYRAGHDAEAEAAHARALHLAPEDPVFLFRFSLFLQRGGRFAEALALARTAAARRPDLAGLQRHRQRLERLAGPPSLGGLCLLLANAGMHWGTRTAWRRGWSPFGRLAQP